MIEAFQIDIVSIAIYQHFNRKLFDLSPCLNRFSKSFVFPMEFFYRMLLFHLLTNAISSIELIHNKHLCWNRTHITDKSTLKKVVCKVYHLPKNTNVNRSKQFDLRHCVVRNVLENIHIEKSSSLNCNINRKSSKK